MSTKKIGLVIGMAISAVAMMVPAMASANSGTIRDIGTGNPIVGGATVGLTGTNAKFETLGTGTSCHAASTLTAITDKTGRATFTVPNTHTCTNTGLFAGCTLLSVTSVYPGGGAGFPVETTINTDFVVKEILITNTYNAGCMGGEHVTLHYPEVTLKLPIKNPIGTAELEGEGEATAWGSENEATTKPNEPISEFVNKATGLFHVLAPNIGTYKIE